MNELQLAAARLMLRALERAPDQSITAANLKSCLTHGVIQRVVDREAEYRSFNKDMNSNGACLSADAAAYWSDAEKMLRAGTLAHALGSRRREKAVSLACERLNESFAARVPVADRGKFLVHDLDDPNAWDDRWHACVDFLPPLLRPEFIEAPRIENARARAQFDVLSELLATGLVAGLAPTSTARLIALARGEGSSSLAMKRSNSDLTTG